MPSAAILEQKKQIVADVAEKIKGAVAGVIVDYRGITVEEDTKLRKELRAADEAGLSDIKSVLEGTTAIALSNEDHIAAARILNTFAEGKDYFEIKSGFIDGEVITVEKVKYLAKLPTKEGLIAKALGSLKAPISNLVYALNAIKDKKSEEEAA